VSLADTYDALTSFRAYRPAFAFVDARTIIIQERGRQFEPALVDAFLDCEEHLIGIAREFSDEYCDKPGIFQRLVHEK
jgi:response regulator RpfG family c-di-GMP phosphodiesterase